MVHDGPEVLIGLRSLTEADLSAAQAALLTKRRRVAAGLYGPEESPGDDVRWLADLAVAREKISDALASGETPVLGERHWGEVYYAVELMAARTRSRCRRRRLERMLRAIVDKVLV